MSNTGIGLVQFSVIEVSAWAMGLPGMIGGLGESPGEIAIAVFGIAFALDLFVTGPATGDLPTIGSIMAHVL